MVLLQLCFAQFLFQTTNPCDREWNIATATSRSGCSNSPSPRREEKGLGDEEVRPA